MICTYINLFQCFGIMRAVTESEYRIIPNNNVLMLAFLHGLGATSAEYIREFKMSSRELKNIYKRVQ